MYKPFLRSFAAAGLLLVALSAYGQPSYSLTDLGSLGGNQTISTGLNGHGQVIGYSAVVTNGDSHGFLYQNGSMQDLGTLSGGTSSAANGINRLGQVAGDATTAQGAFHAFLYSGGIQDLGTLGGNDSVANAINGNGQVVGWSGLAGVPEFGPDGSEHAFLYSGGTMQDLGSLNGGQYSQATGINDSGQVVGQSDIAPGSAVYHAFLYSNGSMQDLGTLEASGSDSQANGINKSGQVVGWSYVGANNYYHAFLYSKGQMQDLGTLTGVVGTSQGNAINARGQIVGWSNASVPAGQSSQHAFLYSNGTMLDLNTLDTSSPLASFVTLYSATGITDHGWIAANGIDSRTGATHAYLLIPLKSHR